MEGYLGTTPAEVNDTPFAAYTPTDWAMYWIGSYGQIDGSHHKLWVLDQVARILKGTPVLINKAAWANGHTEWRCDLGEPSQAYLDWVEELRGEWHEDAQDYDYLYDEGIAP